MTLRDVLAPAAVAALVYVGLFKGAPFMQWAPVDLTLVAAGVLAVVVAAYLLTTKDPLRVSVLWVLFAAACAPALLYPVWDETAWDKRFRLLIPALVVVATCCLLRSYVRQRVWVWLQVAVGVLLVATSTAAYSDAAERFAGAGSNTISAGRASGVAIVALTLLLLTGGLRRPWTILLAGGVTAWLAYALIDTGSRGPVAACALAILVTVVIAPGRARALRLLAAGGALAAGWVVLSGTTGLGANRLTGSLTGQYDLAGPRLLLWGYATNAIPDTPFGLGWGNYASVVPPAFQADWAYPHNTILEVTVEAGWVAGLLAIVVLARAIFLLRRNAGHPYGAALLGIAMFFVVNAMVSGDLNDNRAMWAAVAIAWVLQAPTRITSAQPSDTGHPRKRVQSNSP